MAKKFEYGEKESKHTERAYLAPEVVRQRLRTVEMLGPQDGEHILDVGCGPGLLVHDLAVSVGAEGRVLGVDNSTAMLELAARRCESLSQVELVEADATSLPSGATAFDAATCVQVLLYVEDPGVALAEIHRALKPGGRAVFMETDWHGMVVSSSDQALTARMTAAWDRKVPSPNLPTRLTPILHRGEKKPVDAEEERIVGVLTFQFVHPFPAFGLADRALVAGQPGEIRQHTPGIAFAPEGRAQDGKRLDTNGTEAMLA